MSTTLLGLDPGEQTGFCFIDVTDGKPVLGSFGVVPVTEPGRAGLVESVNRWMNYAQPNSGHAAMSEIIQMPRVPTSHAALEVQGVLRLWGCVGYKPATVHSVLGTHKKTDVAALLERLFGVRVRPDHAADAAAVAIVHGIQTGQISKLDFAPQEEPTGLRKPRVQAVAEDKADYTSEELVDLIKSGKAKVAR